MLRFTNVDSEPTKLPPIYAYRTHPLLPLRQALEPVLSRINKLDEFIKVARDECHHPSEHGLTHEESASIYLYTMEWGAQSLYRVLNEALRIKDRSTLEPWHGYLKLFDTAIGKLPGLRMNLWRGVKGNISQNYQGDTRLTWWNISSCSAAVKVLQAFLGPVSTIFMIEAKNGKDISIYSSLPKEKEVVLGLGTRLHVVSDPLAHTSLNVVHMVELTDGNDEELPSNTPTSMNRTWPLNQTTSKYFYMDD